MPKNIISALSGLAPACQLPISELKNMPVKNPYADANSNMCMRCFISNGKSMGVFTDFIKFTETKITHKNNNTSPNFPIPTFKTGANIAKEIIIRQLKILTMEMQL